MGVRGYFKKVTTFLLVPIFLAQSVWSMPASEVLAARPLTKPAASFFSNINDPILRADFFQKNPPRVPVVLGESVESFSGSAPFRVFVIQDAHALPEAQKSAAKILSFWVSQLGLNFVGLEGARGNLPHSALAAFPNHTARRMLAETLLNEAVIGGPEYLQMTKYPSLKLRGVEDSLLYEADRAAFLQVLSQREDSARLLNLMRSHAEEHALKILPVEYLRYRKQARQAYEKGDWQGHLTQLQKLRFENHLTGRYPAFDFWRKAHELSEKVDPKAMEAEIKQIGKKGKLGRLLAGYAAQLANGVEPEKEIRIEALLWKQNPAWLKRFPAVTSALKAAYLMRRVGSGLFDEMSNLEKELSQKMCPESEQAKIVRRLENLDVVRSLISLSLTAPDYKEFLSRRADFQVGALSEANQVVFNQTEKKQLSGTLSAAENFYGIAMRRDEALAKNFIQEMRNENQKFGALIVGGFHTAGLLNVFRERGISYEVVRPKIKDAGTDRHQAVYEKRMGSQVSRLEWVKPASPEHSGLTSYAQLQLQTPRRQDMGFLRMAYSLLTGMAAVMRSRLVDWNSVLTASAPVLSAEGIRDLSSLGAVNRLSQVWTSPDGNNTVFWFPGAGQQMSLMTATGPNAKALAGKGAVLIQAADQQVWTRLGGVSPEPGLKKWKPVLMKRAELRADDHLAFLTQRSSFEDLADIANFERAVEIRIEAFADVLKLPSSGETQKLSLGGTTFSFRYKDGKAKMISFETNWKDVNMSVQTRALMLIYLEEYWNGMSLSSRQQVKTAAVVDRVIGRFLQRAQSQKLIQAFLNSQPPIERMAFWQKTLFLSAQLFQQTGSSKEVSQNIPVLIAGHNSSRDQKIDIVAADAGWEGWKNTSQNSARASSAQILKEIKGNSRRTAASLSHDQLPEFLLRHARNKITSKLRFDPDFSEGLSGETLLWAQELAELAQEQNPDPATAPPAKKLLPPDTSLLPGTSHLSSSADVGETLLLPPTELKEVNWFEGLPAIEDLDKQSFEQLKGFLAIWEKRRLANLDQFLLDSRQVLPYWEKMVSLMRAMADQAQLQGKTGVQKKISPQPILHKSAVIIDAGILLGAAWFVGMTLPALAIAAGLITAYRSGWMGGVLLNEWGHQTAALSKLHLRTFFLRPANWIANWTFGNVIVSLLPFAPLRTGAAIMHPANLSIDPNAAEKQTKYFQRMGWIFGVIGFSALAYFYFTAFMALSPALTFAGFVAAAAAQIAAFYSDFINPPKEAGCANCGNARVGVLITNLGDREADFGDLDIFLNKVYRDVLIGTQSRGRLGLGIEVNMIEADSGQSVYAMHPLYGETPEGAVPPALPRTDKMFIDKRDDAVKKFAEFAQDIREMAKLMNGPFYLDIATHVQYPTGGVDEKGMTINERKKNIHPHSYSGWKLVDTLIKTAGQWKEVAVWIKTAIAHNGDANHNRHGPDHEVHSNMVQRWALKRALKIDNEAMVDTVTVSAELELTKSQGLLKQSIVFSHFHNVATNIAYFFGGKIPKDAAEEAEAGDFSITREDEKILVSVFGKALQHAGITNYLDRVTDGIENITHDQLAGVLNLVSDADLEEIREKAFEYVVADASAQKIFLDWHHIRTGFNSVPEVYDPATDLVSRQFIMGAVQAYFRNDEYTSWKQILPDFIGSAGINNLMSNSVNKWTAVSMGQTIVIAFGMQKTKDGRSIPQIGSFSELTAASVEGFDFFFVLDNLGEVAEISHDGKNVYFNRVYSTVEGRELTAEEIAARIKPVKRVAMPTKDQSRHAAKTEIASLPVSLDVTAKEWHGIPTEQVPEPHNNHVGLQFSQSIVAGPVGRAIETAVRSQVERGLLDSIFSAEAEKLLPDVIQAMNLPSTDGAPGEAKAVRDLAGELLRREFLILAHHDPLFIERVTAKSHEILERHLAGANSQAPIEQATINQAAAALLKEVVGKITAGKASKTMDQLARAGIQAQAHIRRTLNPAMAPSFIQAAASGEGLVEQIENILPALPESRKGYDLYPIGKEFNEVTFKSWVLDLKKLWPEINIAPPVDPNDVMEAAHIFRRNPNNPEIDLENLDVEGLRARLGMHDNPYAVGLVGTFSSETFSSIFAALLGVRIVPEMFMMSSTADKPGGIAVTQERTFLVRSPWSPSELHMGSVAITAANLIELTHFMVRTLPARIGNTPLFGRRGDFTEKLEGNLERAYQRLLEESVPAITGHTKRGELTRESVPDRQKIIDFAENTVGKRIHEGTETWVYSTVYLGLVVALPFFVKVAALVFPVVKGFAIPPLFQSLHLLFFWAGHFFPPFWLFTAASFVLYVPALVKVVKAYLSSGKEVPANFLAAKQKFLFALILQTVFAMTIGAPEVADWLFFVFMGAPLIPWARRKIIRLFHKEGALSEGDRVGTKSLYIVTKSPRNAEIAKILLRKAFNLSPGITGIFVDAKEANVAMDSLFPGRESIVIGFVPDGRVPTLDVAEEAVLMVLRQWKAQIANPFKGADKMGVPLAGPYIATIGSRPNLSARASNLHIAVDVNTHAPQNTPEDRLTQELLLSEVSDLKELLEVFIFVTALAEYVSRPRWDKPWTYITQWNYNFTRAGAGTHTTADPIPGDALFTFLQKMDKVLRPITPWRKKTTVQLPDYVKLTPPDQLVIRAANSAPRVTSTQKNRSAPKKVSLYSAQNRDREAQVKQAAAMKTFADEAHERLVKAQQEIIKFELFQMNQLADLAKHETRDGLKKLVYQALLYHQVQTYGGWIGMNGVSPAVKQDFRAKVKHLKTRAGVDDQFGQQSINQTIRVAEFDALHRKHAREPQVLAAELSKRIVARAELREQPSSESIAAGLTATDNVRAGMLVDEEARKMFELLRLPKQQLQEASDETDFIKKSGASDVGLVVLEKQFSPAWIRKFINRLPGGVRVVLRVHPKDRSFNSVFYLNELKAEIRRGHFKVEISDVQSEVWIKDWWTQQDFGGEFESTAVIQVEEGGAELDEMLLLSAPMAAGHVLLLGRPKRLNLIGVRWIQIKAWVNQLYDTVMATQRSA